MPGLGAKLLAARTEKGLSLSDVKDAVGVDRTNLSLYERDLKSPTLPVLYRLAQAYGVPPSELLPPAAHATLPIEESLPAVEPTPRVIGKRK